MIGTDPNLQPPDIVTDSTGGTGTTKRSDAQEEWMRCMSKLGLCMPVTFEQVNKSMQLEPTFVARGSAVADDYIMVQVESLATAKSAEVVQGFNHGRKFQREDHLLVLLVSSPTTSSKITFKVKRKRDYDKDRIMKEPMQSAGLQLDDLLAKAQ